MIAYLGAAVFVVAILSIPAVLLRRAARDAAEREQANLGRAFHRNGGGR